MAAAALPSPPRLRGWPWALGMSGLIVAELLGFAYLGTRRFLPDAVFYGAAADAVLWSGLAVLVLVRRHGHAWPRPRRLLRDVLIALAIYRVLVRLLHLPSPHWAVLGALFELGVMVLTVRTLRQGWRGARSGESGLERARGALSSVLPDRVAELLLTEIALLVGAFAPPRAMPDPARFTAMERSKSGFIIPLVVLMMSVEMPAVHLLLHFVAHARAWVHVALIGLELYGLVWLIGDRRWMATTGHRLRRDALEIELGLRWRGRVPYAWIREIRALSWPVAASAGARKISPWDAPNVEIRLDREVELATYFGIRRSARVLRIFVDEPERLLSTLSPLVADPDR